MADRDDYYLALAFTVATRAECGSRRGGAVLVSDDRVIATGYTGIPEDLRSEEAGCQRCRMGDSAQPDTTCELTLCMSADMVALMSAARHGAGTAGSVLYSTDQPGFTASKALVQAGVARVVFARTWSPDDRVVDDHRRLQKVLGATHVPTEYEIQVLE